jgi:hypothetical protein
MLFFEGKPISFKNYHLAQQILDTKANIKMIKAGRQVSKSMTLMEDMMADIITTPFKKLLYVAPQVDHVRAFSLERIGDRVEESPIFRKHYINKDSIKNMGHRTFANNSGIYFRAQTQIKIIRGLSVHKICYDEIQDLLSETIIIADETMSGRETFEKWYTGTPLTVQNYIETLWNMSSKIVPILICEFGHHQVPYLGNISPDHIRCRVGKCNAKIDVRKAYLKRMGKKDADICGFWVPQIALPLHTENEEKWKVLVHKHKNLPPEKFLNEVMGISAGQGVFLVSEKDLRKCCKDFRDGSEFDMWQHYHPPHTHGIREMWCGIDWAVTNRVSFTVICVGGFDEETNRFRVVHATKCQDPDPLRTLDQICEIITKFGVSQIGADWGAGYMQNRMLEARLNMPVMRMMYAQDRVPMAYDKAGGLYKASRTLTLLNSFNQMRAQRIHFFKWKEFEEFAEHILAEFFEGDEDNLGNAKLKFDHPPEKPDDFLHAFSVMFNLFQFHRDPYRTMFR